MPAGGEEGHTATGSGTGAPAGRRVAPVGFPVLNAVAGAALLAVCLATGLGFLGSWGRFFDLLGQPRLQYALMLALGACLAVHAFSVGPATGSDHSPVAVDFSITGSRP